MKSHKWKAGERLRELGSELKEYVAKANTMINTYDIYNFIKQIRLIRKQTYRIETITQGIINKMGGVGRSNPNLIIADGETPTNALLMPRYTRYSPPSESITRRHK